MIAIIFREKSGNQGKVENTYEETEKFSGGFEEIKYGFVKVNCFSVWLICVLISYIILTTVLKTILSLKVFKIWMKRIF